MAKLTAKEERFVEEYLIDLNGSAAYKRSHPKANDSTSRTEASRLLAREEVQLAISNAKAARSQRTGLEQDRVVRELARIAFLDPRRALNAEGELISPTQLPSDVARAISAIDCSKGKIKFHAKIPALLALLEHLKPSNAAVTKSIELVVRDYTTDKNDEGGSEN